MTSAESRKKAFFDWRDQDCEVVVEGEFDALVAIANGMLAVSGTSGAGTFTNEWADALTGQSRRLLYDHDEAGCRGAGVDAVLHGGG